jgi:hypothetical protein
MFGIRTKMTPDLRKLEKAQDKGAFKSFSHAAGSIRKSAIASIESSNTPGPPGGPIRTRLSNKRRKRRPKGAPKRKRRKPPGLAKRAILFQADKHGAVIGFTHSKISAAMSAHEHGKKYKGTLFPKRPTMFPALQRRLARFHHEWKGAI